MQSILPMIISCLIMGACTKETHFFPTWASVGLMPGRTRPVIIEDIPDISVTPWAGTISHHLLTDQLIETWFAELAKRRNIVRFYVLSPSHWNLSTQDFSLTDGSWDVANGNYVQSDIKEVHRIARALQVELEPQVFVQEHGVSTLMPYIKRYFPDAKVVSIAFHGEPPLNQPLAAQLSSVLQSSFSQKGKKENFLLISADFAHHGDSEGTNLKDTRTRRFFEDPSKTTWIFAGCDNRPGIYALAQLMSPITRCAILYHCDSYYLSGHDPHDITSYFFTWFWD